MINLYNYREGKLDDKPQLERQLIKTALVSLKNPDILIALIPNKQ